MTLAMAMTDGTRTWIGSDTATGNGRQWKWPSVIQKWLPCKGWMVAFTGDSSLDRAIARVNSSTHEWADDYLGLCSMVDEIFIAYESHGFKPTHREGHKPEYDLPLILARAGEVWMCDYELCLLRIPAGEWICIGCSDEIAYGVLSTLSEMPDFTPREAMRRAVRLSQKFYPIIQGFWSDVLEPAP